MGVAQNRETLFHHLVSLLTRLNDLGFPHFRNHQKKDMDTQKSINCLDEMEWNDHKAVSPERPNFVWNDVCSTSHGHMKGSRFGCQGADANVQAQNPKSHPAHRAVGVGIFLNLALITPKLLGLVGKLWNYTECVKWRQLMVKWYDGMIWNGWKCMGCRIIRRRVIIVMWSWYIQFQGEPLPWPLRISSKLSWPAESALPGSLGPRPA